jgi:hypothetical protein
MAQSLHPDEALVGVQPCLGVSWSQCELCSGRKLFLAKVDAHPGNVLAQVFGIVRLPEQIDGEDILAIDAAITS